MFDNRHASHILFPALLVLLAIACTWGYYRWGYTQGIFAEDRLNQIFQGFHKIEGEPPRIYRWTDGQGTVCLPAAGHGRPPLALRLDLLGQSDDLQIREFVARVGSTALLLPVEQHDSRYHLLLPPDATLGPVCVELISSARMPEGDERLLGVGVRSIRLERLPAAPTRIPPLDQLAVNGGLALGGFWLLRRWHLARSLAAALVAGVTLAASGALLGGWVRFAPDLPLMTVGALAGVVAVLASDLLRRDLLARTGEPWAREWLGAGVTALLLLGTFFGFQALAGYPLGSYPLMARMGPRFSPDVVWPLACFVVWLTLLLRWLHAERPPAPLVAILVSWLAAFGLAVLLKAGLRGVESLFQTFTWQPEDYIRDVRRVGDDPLGFLRNYVELMPRLARHNRTHPPGSTLFLWWLAQTVGPGPQVATWVVIALGALGVWPTYLLTRWAAAPLGEQEGGRMGLIAAAVYGLLPAQLVFGATSMDAVFATVLAAASYCLARAIVFEPQRAQRAQSNDSFSLAWRPLPPWVYALLAGFWLAVGLLLVFTTLVLGLFVVALVLYVLVNWQGWETLKRLIIQGALICGVVVLLLGGVWAATGYDSWAALRAGTANNTIDVAERTPPPGPATYLFFLGANLVAWGVYLGPWGVNLLAGGCAAALRRLRAAPERTTAVLVATAALIVGLFVSGLFVREVERVFLCTHILVAFALAYGITQRGRALGLGRYTALVLAALFAEALLIRSLLRIYW